MNEKVSVVVPVYNVEQYLAQCVESILGQTYTNLEIILVDDGSSDNCPEICDAYAAQDSRVKVVHKENGGQAEARNVAIDVATGEYITFIDSDDFVCPEYLEVLYTSIHDAQADISIVGFSDYFDGNHIRRKKYYSGVNKVFTQKEAIRKQLCRECITVAVWAKLYRAEIFSDIRFPVGEIYEDLAIFYNLLLRAQRVVYTDMPLYCYRIRQGSTMQQGFDMRQYAEVRWIERAMAMVAEKYPEFDQEIRGRCVWSYFKTLYRILCSHDKDKYRIYQDEMISKIRQESKYLLKSSSIDRNLKIKIGSLYFGRYSYFVVQKISDTIKYLKVGRRYVV